MYNFLRITGNLFFGLYTYMLRYSDLTNLLKIDLLHKYLNWRKISETTLEMPFFNTLRHVYAKIGY
jgi:hypothetical protein